MLEKLACALMVLSLTTCGCSSGSPAGSAGGDSGGSAAGRGGATATAGATGGGGGAGTTGGAGPSGVAGSGGGSAGGGGTFGSGGAATGIAGSGGATGAGGSGTGVFEYAGTIVNPINSGNEVVLRKMDVTNTLCVLVDVFVLVGGQVQGPIKAYALPVDAAQCLVATTTNGANSAMATASTGAITSPDGGSHFDVNLQLTFPPGFDWLATSVTFQTRGLPLDDAWHPPQ